jgi:glucan phosphoethanolaminetransferase (alkaline phosphatase superfamily)
MTETAIDRFWELVLGAIALKEEAFELIQTLPLGARAALYIVLIAGLSQAIGQGIVLFINRVKPLRFVLSLLIAAILFAFGYIFWVVSTWFACYLLLGRNTSYSALELTLGLAYAPLMLSFFVGLPYLGVPISVLLSVWSFLAFLTGLKVALGLGVWQAFWCSALGWAVFEVLQRTIGRPVAAVGRWLTSTVAGVNLVTDLKDLERILETGVQRASGNSGNQQSRR